MKTTQKTITVGEFVDRCNKKRSMNMNSRRYFARKREIDDSQNFQKKKNVSNSILNTAVMWVAHAREDEGDKAEWTP